MSTNICIRAHQMNTICALKSFALNKNISNFAARNKNIINMKRILSIIVISLCTVLMTHAQTIVYMHEASTDELGPETQYTPRHARSANIVPLVETCENIYNITVYNARGYDYEIYFTDINNVILHYQKGTLDDSMLRITIPDIINKDIKAIIIKVNNQTYIGYKQ